MTRPLSCPNVRRRIDDHVDGLLPAEEAERVRDHLDSCPECRETAFAARAASTSLAAWGDLEPPAKCFDGILARIHTLPPEALERSARRAATSRTWARIVRLSLPAAVAAALVAAFVLTERPVRDRTPRLSQSSGLLSSSMVSNRVHPRLLPGEEFVTPDDAMDDGLLRSRRPGEGEFRPEDTPVRFLWGTPR